MRVLVTGGAGFIGSHLVEGLLRKGYQVTVADDLSTGDLGNLEAVRDQIEFLQLDLADLEQARIAVRGVDAVLHEAAIPSVPRSVADPIGSNRANIDGTLNTLVAARDEGVKRFVYAASSSAYGQGPELPKVESLPPDPISPYAIGKLTGEFYCQAFYRLYGLPTICLRYFNVFGPRQDPNSEYAAVIPKFITRLLNGERPVIYGDGEQSRDFTYVDNVVHANLLALETERGFGEMMNAACGERFTLNELFRKLCEIIGAECEPVYEDERPGDVKHSHADISKARSLLGYEPMVSFEEGLRRTVDYFRSTMEAARR
ncbi:MAG: GDP-mannose 4,6-dehydratase [Armatimonadota bacterium]|nr:MAG: GDP-mannose 4,6-dehydratase [Armatimonadota bacterium]